MDISPLPSQIEPTTPKILLVDDDQFVRVVYKDGLEKEGYTVITAADGEEALQMIKSELPSLIIMEIIVPKLNGFEVLKTIKADPGLSTIPVLVLTNLSQESDEQEARKYGAADFVIKFNASFNDVVLKVQQLLADAGPMPSPGPEVTPPSPTPSAGSGGQSITIVEG